MTAYEYEGFTISEHMMDALQRYIRDRIPPGGFLMAVLENNLASAVGRADLINRRNLPAFAAYLYNNAPSDCWGSPEKVAKWLAAREV